MEECLHQSNIVLTIPIPVAMSRGRQCGDVQRYAVVGVQGEADLMNSNQQSEAAVKSKTTRDGHAHHGLTLGSIEPWRGRLVDGELIHLVGSTRGAR
jgi:hypothetical protein